MGIGVRWGLELREEVGRGWEGGGNGGDGRAVELLQSMRRWCTDYLHLKAVRGQWLLALIVGWG